MYTIDYKRKANRIGKKKRKSQPKGVSVGRKGKMERTKLARIVVECKRLYGNLQ